MTGEDIDARARQHANAPRVGRGRKLRPVRKPGGLEMQRNPVTWEGLWNTARDLPEDREIDRRQRAAVREVRDHPGLMAARSGSGKMRKWGQLRPALEDAFDA